MGRITLVAVVAVFVLAALGWMSLRVGPDVPVPASLVTVLEPAREAARREAGFVGLAPARLVAARCTTDGATAVLTFESTIASARSFAVVGFPPAEEWDAPGATIVIAGVTAEPTIGTSDESCRHVPTGPKTTP